jgi:hypothetical protein
MKQLLAARCNINLRGKDGATREGEKLQHTSTRSILEDIQGLETPSTLHRPVMGGNHFKFV